MPVGVAAVLGRHRRLHPAWADGVDADALRRVLDTGPLAEPDDAVLGRGVGGQARRTAEPADGGDVDDRPGALRHHVSELVLHAEPDCGEVDGDLTVPVGLLDLVGGLAVADDTGVVHSEVETAETLDGPGDQRFHVRCVGDVGGDRDRGVPGVGQALGFAFDELGSARREHDRRTGFGEPSGGCQADASGGSCDEGDPSGHVGAHGECSSSSAPARGRVPRVLSVRLFTAPGSASRSAPGRRCRARARRARRCRGRRWPRPHRR